MDNTKVRLTHPAKGWVKLSWHPQGLPSAGALAEVSKLEKLPGVCVEESSIEIPQTGWNNAAALLGIVGRKVPVRDRAGYVMPDGLHPWQVSAVRQGMDAGNLFLCDDMGLGKTRSAIALAMSYRSSLGYGQVINPNVVVAPSFTVDVWRRELLEMGAIKNESEFCVLRSRNLNDGSWNPKARWYFVHYEIVHYWASRLTMLPPLVAIVDEAHWVKNGRTNRFRGTQIAIARAEMRICLTGTPMSNRVDELWAPLTLVTGPKTWGHPIAFRKHYCGAQPGPYGFHDTGPTNVEELRERMAPWYLRRTKDELGSLLPSLTRQRLSISMSDKDAAKHKIDAAAAQEMVNALLQGRAGPDVFRLIDKLRKITSKAKLKATAAQVQSLLEQGESVVVFCWQKSTVDQLARKLVDAGFATVQVTGAQPQPVRDMLIEQYQASTGAVVLIATYGALKEGVTLTKARAIVLHDLDWVPSTILQAEARIHRLGQLWACMSYWMVAENSIDTILAKLLLMKAEHIEKTLGISAPSKAVDELDLSNLIEQHKPEQWAREQLAKWFQ